MEPNQDDEPLGATQRAQRTIVVVDVVESVRLMQADEAGVIDRWRRFVNEVRSRVLPIQGGRLVKSLGDGLLMEFESVPPAIAALLDMHERIAAYNPGLPPQAAMHLRGGVHVADVVVDQLDVYGAGVNLAARLTSLAGPGDCVVSAEVRDQLVDGLDGDIEDLGDCYLKNLDAPVRAYRLRAANSASMPPRDAVVMDLRPTVAVLSLTPRTAGGDRGVVGDVVADEVSISLSRCAELQVISRLSTAAYKNRSVPPQQLHESLGAVYVLTGSYHVLGGKVRMHLELSDVRHAQVLWADSVGAGVSALLAGDEPAIERVVGNVAAAIISREVLRATSLPLPNVESHALMSSAITLMHRASEREFERARQMIEHLRERHRGLPQPHAWLAKWHVLRVVQGWSTDPQRDGGEALDAGHRALDGDPNSSLALAMQGLVHAYLRRDFDSASQSYRHALSVNPNESLALLLLGTMHAFLGEGTPAWELTQRALRLSPLDPLRYFYLSLSASAAISAGRYGDAIDLAQRSLKANCAHLSTYRALAIAQSLAGYIDEAKATVSRLLSLEPGFNKRRFLERYPGHGRVPNYARFLADALDRAGLPA